MSDRHAIRNNAIGTAIGTLIVSAVVWAFGLAPRAWRLLTKAANDIAAFLAGSVSIPLWMLLLGLLIAVLLLRKFITTHAAEPATDQIDAPVDASEYDSFSADERAVLKVLVDLDGQGATVDAIANAIRQPRLIVVAAVERMLEIGILHNTLSTVSGAKYFLSPAGRDLVISHGLVPRRS